MADKKKMLDLGQAVSNLNATTAALIQGTGATSCKQPPATEEEREQRIKEFRTQGRRGCRSTGKRMNLILSAENADCLNAIAATRGITTTQACNEAITFYLNAHPEIKSVMAAMTAARKDATK